jgi:hypothetical protein
VAILVIVQLAFQLPEFVVDAVVRARPQKDKLAAISQTVKEGMPHQFNAFLSVQPTYHSHNGLINLPKQQTITKCFLVLVLVFNTVDRIATGNERIDFRIPDLVVNAVEHTSEFHAMDPKDVLQSATEVRILDFLRIVRGHRGNKIGINDAPFHQVDPCVVAVILQAVPRSIRGGIQTHLTEHGIPGHTLMHDIVEGETYSGVGHAQVFVHVKKKHRHQPGLPVMAVDDIRVLVGLEHKLQRRPAKECETLRVVRMPIEDASIEEILMGMGFDEKAFQSMDKAKIDVTVKILIVVGDPKIAISFLQAPDVVVTHAVIFRQNDFDGIAS